MLFYRRDDKPSIPFPGQLAMIGGHIESGETAMQTLRRELAEELVDETTDQPFVPPNLRLWQVYVDDANVEHHIHLCELVQQPRLRILEGQGLEWIAREGVANTDFAYSYKEVFVAIADSLATGRS